MPILSPLRFLCCIITVALSFPAHALDIIVSNDDGFESAQTHALYQRLKAAGHRVMISASTQDQSGQGSATTAMRPMAELKKDTRAGSVKAGAPAFGMLPGDEDVYYVDGSPGMSVLYAIDYVAPKKWNKRPDLVISGPNYGNNLAAAAVGSGTIAAALFATNRGVPGIAVSDAHTFHYRDYTQLKSGDIDYEIADVTLRLVKQLEQQAKKTHKPILPPGIALNVNIPAFAAGTGDKIKFKMTRLGQQTGIYYSNDLSQDPNAKAFGVNLPAVPGFSWAAKETPADMHLPVDTDPNTETVTQGVVAISVMQGMPQAGANDERAIKDRLKGFVSSGK
jgi:5'-nucleotidase